MKRCIRCQEDKPVTEFNKDHDSKDGLQVYCRLCHREIVRQGYRKRRADNPDGFPAPTHAKCSMCNETLPAEAFHRRRFSRRGLSHYCKTCHKIDGIARLYDISREEARELLDRKTCAICGLAARRLVIDHCHDTGRVRGVLCSSCNTGLGIFKDQPKVLRAAVSYLEAA